MRFFGDWVYQNIVYDYCDSSRTVAISGKPSGAVEKKEKNWTWDISLHEQDNTSLMLTNEFSNWE